MADWFDEPPQSSGSYTSTIGLPAGFGGGVGGGIAGELGVGSGGSASESIPASITSAQTDWGLLQSTLLSALGNRTYNWAMDQYAKGEGVTNQTIQQFFEMSGKAKGLTDTLINQYQDQIKPLMDQYFREAGTYASDERQAFEAGKAMSTVGQANAAAMSEIERKLEGQGINVNSGRIQEQLIASRVADAAARAGAGTKAAQDTEAIGRQMLEKSIAMGQAMPGQAMDAAKTAIAGLNGAESAILGLLNAGSDLAKAAAPYHNAAVAANKVPPVAQTSKSATQPQTGAGSGSGGGAKGGGGGGGQKGGGQKGGGEGGGGKGGGAPKGDGKGGGDRDSGKLNPFTGGATRIQAQPATMKVPGKSEEEKREEDATGAPSQAGYSGPLGYVDDTGTIYPQYSQDVGKTTWDQALADPAPPAWTLPADPYGFNAQGAGASIGAGANTGLGGADLGATWESALQNPVGGAGSSTSGFDEAGFDTDYDRYGGQNFQQYASRGDIASDATGSESYQQDSSDSDESGGSDSDEGGGGYDYGEGGGSDYDEGGGSDSDEGGGYDYGEGGGSDYDDSDYNYDAGDYDSDYDSYYDEGGGYDYGEGGGSEYYDDSDSEYYADDGYYDDGGGYDYGEGGGSEYYDDSSYYDDGGGYYDDGGGYDYGEGGGSEYYDDSGYSDGEYYAASGGQIPSRSRRPQRPMGQGVMPTTGGAVPRSASPSQGRQTDDISARLNAGEYVIPRDVVKHQGTKFFSDLIAKSRKLRTGMAGAKPKPTLKPAIPNARPTFQSRALPPR